MTIVGFNRYQKALVSMKNLQNLAPPPKSMKSGCINYKK